MRTSLFPRRTLSALLLSVKNESNAMYILSSLCKNCPTRRLAICVPPRPDTYSNSKQLRSPVTKPEIQAAIGRELDQPFPLASEPSERYQDQNDNENETQPS